MCPVHSSNLLQIFSFIYNVYVKITVFFIKNLQEKTDLFFHAEFVFHLNVYSKQLKHILVFNLFAYGVKIC